MSDPVSFDLLGVTVNPLTIAELNAKIAKAIETRARWIIANHNLHSIYLYHHSKRMRAFFNHAKLTHIDGMSLVLIGQFLRLPFRKEHRVTYVDWIRPLMYECASKGYRVAFVGSKPGVGEEATRILRDEFAELVIDTHHGYFEVTPGHPENEAVLAFLRQKKPNVLLIGMGMPRQEHWILDNLDGIEANVILTAGACMDYVAGVVPTPPRWMGRMGLEWVYRLQAEPRRLWRRYLVEPWFLLRLLGRDVWQRRGAGRKG